MIKNFLLIVCLLSFTKSFSQTPKLIGEWFLDRVYQSDGQNVGINNRKYSMSLSYKIKPDELKINDQKFKAEFLKDQIKLENRDLKYWFEDNYLLIQEKNEIYTFLKKNDFIKKNPEFNPQIDLVKNDTLIIANQIIKPKFNNDKTLNNFIISNISNDSYKSDNDSYFKAEYILTKDNKITQIKIINPYTPQYHSQFIQALKKAEEYFENPYRKDILLTFENFSLKWIGSVKAKDEKELYTALDIGYKSFQRNDFEKTIKVLNKLDKIQLYEIEFNPSVHEAYILLGISYLALKQNDNACLNFHKAGTITDFNVRNYLKDFCK